MISLAQLQAFSGELEKVGAAALPEPDVAKRPRVPGLKVPRVGAPRLGATTLPGKTPQNPFRPNWKKLGGIGHTLLGTSAVAGAGVTGAKTLKAIKNRNQPAAGAPLAGVGPEKLGVSPEWIARRVMRSTTKLREAALHANKHGDEVARQHVRSKISQGERLLAEALKRKGPGRWNRKGIPHNESPGKAKGQLRVARQFLEESAGPPLKMPTPKKSVPAPKKSVPAPKKDHGSLWYTRNPGLHQVQIRPGWGDAAKDVFG